MGSDIDVNSEQWVWPSSSFSLGGSDEHRQGHHQRSDQDARRQVKQFLKWFMQSLPLIARFCRTSGHVVTSQIRIAGSVSALTAIGKKGLSLEALSYIWRQIVSITLFKRMTFRQAVSKLQPQSRRAQRLYPTNIYLCSNWTSSVVHGIRDERSVRVQPRNEGIIVCAFL
jgi:predicted RNA-binding protein Jag